MKLTVGDRRPLTNLTPETLEQELRSLTTDTDSFAILEWNETDFIQVAHVEPGAYYIDFQDESDASGSLLESQPLDVVLSIFDAVLKGDSSWRTAHPWQPSNDGLYKLVQDYSEDELNKAIAEAEQREQKRLQQCEATISDPSRIKGHIRHYNLVDWWVSEFTDDEKRQIFEAEGAYAADQGMVTEIVFFGDNFDVGHQKVREESEQEEWPGLVLGEVAESTTIGGRPETAWSYLGSIGSMLNRPATRPLAQRFMRQANVLALQEKPTPENAVGLHFFHMQSIETFYPDRDRDPDALPTAISGCEHMISIAPLAAQAFQSEHDMRLPTHKGFEQLAIIRDKQGDFAEAIRLSQEAKAQGWSGDWDNRIARYEKKLAKQKK